MNYKTRKRIWPVSFAAALGVVAMLALLTATVLMPGATAGKMIAPPPDPLALGAPTAVSATANSDTQITLSWTAASGRGVNGYMVQRKSGTGAFAAVSPAHTGTVTMYVDTGLTPSTSYTYQVRAMRSATEDRPMVGGCIRNDTGGRYHRHPRRPRRPAPHRKHDYIRQHQWGRRAANRADHR